MQGAKFSGNETYLAYVAVSGKLKQRRRLGFLSGIIYGFPFAIVLALLAYACLSGCAGKPKKPPGVQPSTSIATGDILDAITLQATQLTSLKARIKLKLTIHDQAQPEIKGQLVFDCLVTEKAFYLFIPSHNAVYVTSINDKLRNGKKISSLINEASCLLNPWNVVETQNVEVAPCKEERNFKDYEKPVCISFFHQGGPGWVKFDRQTLSPISLENPELQVLYDDPVLLGDGAPYPSKIWIKLKKLHLEIKITLKDIQPGSLTPEDPVFDPTPYFNQPLRPLMLLLDSLR
ncbi:MAG: hypothetical protein JRF43_06175 [Deltaproteobacteria bacterium]|nr:hypothetical protein [Deltaproteobacteria bacterium]